MSLKGKVIAITGAASGIGLATAMQLAAEGAKLSLCDVQEAKLTKLVEDLKQSTGRQDIIGTVVDVSNRETVDNWIKSTVQQLGRLDGAANIAGISGKGDGITPIQDIEDEVWDTVFGVNVKGTLNCLRAQIPAFNDGGSILNFASLAGIMGSPNAGPYCASKHAVIGLSRVAARELGPRKIRVNCILPGPIDTPLLASAAERNAPQMAAFEVMAALGRKGEPSEVAALVEFLLSSKSSYITGTNQVCDGGFIC